MIGQNNVSEKAALFVMEEAEQKKQRQFLKVFPWYAGLSSDLLFWVAIDTLFFTVVRKLSPAQIVSLTSVSVIGGIILQGPSLFVIKKIGNTASVRLGSLFLLLSSIFLAFGPTYILIGVGKILYELAFTFKNMGNAMLENNLALSGQGDRYVKIRTRSNTIYAVITMLISFVAGVMFNFNNYLPVVAAIFFCLICFVLSFFMEDLSEKNAGGALPPKTNNSGEKIHYTRLVILILLSFGLFYPVTNSGQSNGKLLIQDVLLGSTDVEKTALIISAILSVSRIIRVISNLFFSRIYDRFKDRVGVALPVLLLLSLILHILGFYLPAPLPVKILVMSAGYMIILFIRDPFKVYAENLMLKSVSISQQQSMLTALDFFRKIIRALMSLSFTAVLTYNHIVVVVEILAALSVAEIFISLILYKAVSKRAARTDG